MFLHGIANEQENCTVRLLRPAVSKAELAQNMHAIAVCNSLEQWMVRHPTVAACAGMCCGIPARTLYSFNVACLVTAQAFNRVKI